MSSPELRFLHGNHFRRCRARVDKRYEGYHTLQLLTAGRVELFYDDRRHLLEPVSLWPADPGPQVRFHPAEQDGCWEHRYLAVTGSRVEAWLAEGLWPREPRPVEGVAEMVTLFDQARTSFERGDPLGHALGANAVEAILLRLEDERRRAGAPAWYLAARRRLAEAPVQELDLKTAARDAGMAPGTFRRRFKAIAGITPRDFALDARLRRARRLLLEDERPIAAIAAALGYRDDALFCRQFRARLGMTPGDYRRLTWR